MPPVTPPLEALHGSEITLTDGILACRYHANEENLFAQIDASAYFEEVFANSHDEWYAEPEFCGHYLDAAMEFYDARQDEELLHRARGLVETILRNQRPNGYLGTYEEGREFGRTFSIWNQQFVIMGLLSFYERTAYEPALEGAEKCATFIARHYLREKGASLLKCLNYGIQNSTILLEFVRLLRFSDKKLYRDFIDLILKRWGESNIRLVDVADPEVIPMYELGCHKGIEVLICYQGIAELYRQTGDERYLRACENYWSFLARHQIGLTGNGSIGEVWNPAGRDGLRHVATEFKPNENCVAVGWMMFSSLLHSLTGKKVYFDAFERTLYNHLLGAQAIDGKDFSYYQGTYGRKLHAKKPGEYSCCRFRGLRLFAKLPRYALMKGKDEVRINLYTPVQARTNLNGTVVELEQKTDYPSSGEIEISLRATEEAEFNLLLRRPEWAKSSTVELDGKTIDPPEEDGYFVLRRRWGPSHARLRLKFEMELRHHTAEVEQRPAVAFEYGPVLLAIDSRYHPIDHAAVTMPPRPARSTPEPPGHPHGAPLVAIGIEGRIDGNPSTLVYTDYASAGSFEPDTDRFSVWVPQATAGDASA